MYFLIRADFYIVFALMEVPLFATCLWNIFALINFQNVRQWSVNNLWLIITLLSIQGLISLGLLVVVIAVNFPYFTNILGNPVVLLLVNLVSYFLIFFLVSVAQLICFLIFTLDVRDGTIDP